MFFWVVKEGRHVIVQISLKTVDQVPASAHNKLVEGKTVNMKEPKHTEPDFCFFLFKKDVFFFLD